jgi:hypothetical protein
MAKRGIDNVLGMLVGSLEPVNLPEPKVGPTPEPASPLPAKPPFGVEAETPKAKTMAKAVAARRGRPPGSRAGETPEKKKVTWSIDPGLYEAFVKRSYREECQVWELLERALKEYLKKAEK